MTLISWFLTPRQVTYKIKQICSTMLLCGSNKARLKLMCAAMLCSRVPSWITYIFMGSICKFHKAIFAARSEFVPDCLWMFVGGPVGSGYLITSPPPADRPARPGRALWETGRLLRPSYLCTLVALFWSSVSRTLTPIGTHFPAIFAN
jgi:hypothetical protein